MKRWIVLALALVPFLASAAGFWDGNAALQRGDSSFESGLYVASNSFPPNTQIAIQNLDTGETVMATVTQRIEGQQDILVLLSPKTAAALGLSQGTLGRVRVTVPAAADAAGAAKPSEQTYASDPDLNPGAPYGGADQAAAAAPQTPAAPVPAEAPVPAPSVVANPSETPAETPTATAEAPAETPAETPAATAEAPVETPAEIPATTSAEDQAIIADAEARSPQKQVFLPPREDEKFAYEKPVTVPPQATVTIAQPPAPPASSEAQIKSVEGETGAAPAAAPQTELSLAEAMAPQESRPTEIVGAGSAAPAPQEGEPQIALAAPEPAPEGQAPVSQRPVRTEVTGPARVPPAKPGDSRVALLSPEAPVPQQPGTAKPPAATAPAVTAKPPVSTAPVQTIAALPRSGTGSYFLQLGAYATEKGAKDIASRLAPTYPALVLAPSSSSAAVFRVVIGPLNRAESGTLLTWFRYRGFPDAFVKQE